MAFRLIVNSSFLTKLLFLHKYFIATFIAMQKVKFSSAVISQDLEIRGNKIFSYQKQNRVQYLQLEI